MAQFTVYENINKTTKDTIPFLVDVQSELLNDINTRVVIPMCSVLALDNKPMSNLSPTFEINGASYV
jgi:toxin CcdB